MMLMCPECGNPLDDAGFTNCGRTKGNECSRDRGMFLVLVDEIMNKTDLHLLAKMEENQMPQCFEADRATVVALAKMLMTALRQNQAMAEKLRSYTQHLH